MKLWSTPRGHSGDEISSRSFSYTAIDDVRSLREQLQELKLTVTKQSFRIKQLEGCLSLSTNLARTSSAGTLEPMSSIHLLPVELLVKIFCSVVYHGSFDTYCSCRDAIILSHVCGDWRSITLDIPQLWCNVPSFLQVSGLKAILKRSKLSPLNIFCDTSCSSPRSRIFTTYVTQSNEVQRWKDISWTCPEDIMKGIVYVLNSTKVSSFPHLTTLDLSAQIRKYAFSVPTLEPGTQLPSFPKLAHIRLACISPEELPPSQFPALQTIYIYFRIQPILVARPAMLRMSSLLSLLSRAPNLEQLTLDEAKPILDVKLIPQTCAKGIFTTTTPGSRRTDSNVPATNMEHLTVFSWYHCPPKDLWRFFHFVPMTNLQTLHLLLDPLLSRWQRIHDGESFDMDSMTPLSDYPMATLAVHLPKLVNLVVEFSDVAGLTVCFRKFIVPSLKTLSLAYTPPERLQGYNLIPDLPSPDSIFRNPPMPNLTSLTVSNLNLDPKHMLAFFGYAPSLQSLSLEGCLSVTTFIVSLNTKHSTCANLNSLVFIKCDDLGPASLIKFVLRRRLNAPPPDMKPLGRPLKPLKRRVVRTNPVLSASLKATSPSACARNSHPSEIKSLRVEGCKRVDESDLACLKGPTSGIEVSYGEA